MTFLKQLVTNVINDNCLRAAAAIAYYASLSLPAFLLLVVWVGSVVIDPAAIEARLSREISAFIGAEGARGVMSLLARAAHSRQDGWGKAIGVAALVIGATGMVSHLQKALNDAWHVERAPNRNVVVSAVMRRALSLAVVAVVAFLLLASLVLSAVMSAASEQLAKWVTDQASSGAMSALNAVASIASFTVLFAAMFKVLPAAKVRWRDVWVGALVTTALMLVGKYALGAYFGSKNMQSVYGAAGSLVLVMAWIYYSAFMVLVGVAPYTPTRASWMSGTLSPPSTACATIVHSSVSAILK